MRFRKGKKAFKKLMVEGRPLTGSQVMLARRYTRVSEKAKNTYVRTLNEWTAWSAKNGILKSGIKTYCFVDFNPNTQ